MASGPFLEAGKAEGKSAVSESDLPNAAPKDRKRKSAECSKTTGVNSAPRAAHDTSKPIAVKKRRKPNPSQAVSKEIRGSRIDSTGRADPDVDSSIAVPGIPAPAVVSGAEISWPIARPREQTPAARYLVHVNDVSLFCLSFAIVLWWLVLSTLDPDGLTDLGLISILPPAFFGCLALLSIGFVLSLRQGAQGLLPLLHLGALVFVLHGTPAIAYGTLRYSWAWKHLGIVDYIQRHGTVDPVAAFLPAYHNWPGFFFVAAWIGDLFGLGSLDLSYIVRFTPVFINLGLLWALTLLFRRLTDDRRLVMAAMWIFFIGNWVGQDYFSPQAVAFLLHILLLVLFLGPLRREVPATGLIHRITLQVRTLGLGGRSTEMQVRPYSPLQRSLLSILALLLIIAIVVTHQLTPFVVILSAAALVMIGRLSIGYLVFAVVAELSWLLYFAAPFVATQLAGELETLGAISEASQKFADTAVVSPERVLVVWVGRALSGTVALLAVFGGLRRLAIGFRDIPAIVLTLAPFPLLALAYGGEAVFRVYLFAMPFLAFFAASCFFPSPKHGTSAYCGGLFAILGFVGAIGFLFANNGKDREYRFAPDEVATAYWLYSTAPAGSLLIEGARSYPSQFLNYENFTYVPLSEESDEVKARIVADPEKILARWLSDETRTEAYFFITSSQKAYLEAQGILPPGAVDRIVKTLLASPRFTLAKSSPNAKVFKLFRQPPSHGLN
jgi:hypothetical protein